MRRGKLRGISRVQYLRADGLQFQNRIQRQWIHFPGQCLIESGRSWCSAPRHSLKYAGASGDRGHHLNENFLAHRLQA